MDIKVELDRVIAEQAETINQANKLGEERELLIQEAFRLEGEIRILNKIMEGNKDEPNRNKSKD